MNNYLFFVEHTYCFAILRPLQDEILRQGGSVSWYLLGLSRNLLRSHESFCCSIEEVRSFNPKAVIVPGNRVPQEFPGIKVQVFHGFGIDKKGHFRIRGFFDLYCTHGPLTTEPFMKLAKKHKSFRVVQTGWPKMDSMHNIYDHRIGLKPPYKILYAPTFSPSLTSALDLLDAFERLVSDDNFEVVVKFHPKMNTEWVKLYTDVQGPRLKVLENIDFLQCVNDADIVVSDTSSVVSEALCLGKPVITYNALNPGDHCRNFDVPEMLSAEIKCVCDEYMMHKNKGLDYAKQMHPYYDGKSSMRVIEAIEQFSFDGLKPKPRNFLRNWKMKKAIKRYYQ